MPSLPKLWVSERHRWLQIYMPPGKNEWIISELSTDILIPCTINVLLFFFFWLSPRCAFTCWNVQSKVIKEEGQCVGPASRVDMFISGSRCSICAAAFDRCLYYLSPAHLSPLTPGKNLNREGCWNTSVISEKKQQLPALLVWGKMTFQ